MQNPECLNATWNDEPPKPDCQCEVCVYHRQVVAIRDGGDVEAMKALIDDLYERMYMAEFDIEYYESIMDGSWPQAGEIALGIIERAMKRLGQPRLTRYPNMSTKLQLCKVVNYDDMMIRSGYQDKMAFHDGDVVVMLGELEQCPGHCVIATKDGKVLFGYHTDNFERVDDEEA